jgi:hypothetical protein
MEGYQLDPAFRRLAVFPDGPDEGARRVLEWLDDPPFTPAQREALACERGGAASAADLIERAAARPRVAARLQRQLAEWRRRLPTLIRAARRARVDELA